MRQDVGVHVCDFGNIVWPELSNENPGKALQLFLLMIVFLQMAKNCKDTTLRSQILNCVNQTKC